MNKHLCRLQLLYHVHVWLLKVKEGTFVSVVYYFQTFCLSLWLLMD